MSGGPDTSTASPSGASTSSTRKTSPRSHPRPTYGRRTFARRSSTKPPDHPLVRRTPVCAHPSSELSSHRGSSAAQYAGAEVLPRDGVIAAAYRHRMFAVAGSAAAHGRRVREPHARARWPVDGAGCPGDLSAVPGASARRGVRARLGWEWGGRSSTALPIVVSHSDTS
jgi:hypothetical protein